MMGTDGSELKPGIDTITLVVKRIVSYEKLALDIHVNAKGVVTVKCGGIRAKGEDLGQVLGNVFLQVCERHSELRALALKAESESINPPPGSREEFLEIHRQIRADNGHPF